MTTNHYMDGIVRGLTEVLGNVQSDKFKLMEEYKVTKESYFSNITSPIEQLYKLDIPTTQTVQWNPDEYEVKFLDLVNGKLELELKNKPEGDK